MLEKATDWQVQFDINEEGQVKDRPFPPEIVVVSGEGSRPDGVIWSMESKTVIWIELTSSWEINMPKQHDYKINRSNQLVIDLREGKYFGVKWTVLPFYVEFGTCGAVHELDCKMAYNRMCSKLGFRQGTRSPWKDCANGRCACQPLHLLMSLSQEMGASAVAGPMEII